jgi:lysozyme family protein
MADFKLAVEKTLAYEGGYTNNINDPGGATNWGITLGVLQEQGTIGDYDGDGDVDKDDVKIMSREAAEDIYHKLYWNGDNIQSQAIAEKYFDMGVNMGTATAAKLLQQALVACGFSISVDGKLGPKTINAINAASENGLMTALCNLQENRYWSIVQNDLEKNAIARNWPEDLAADAIMACKAKNLELALSCLQRAKQSKLREGKLTFLTGWLKRGSDRFGI